MYLVCCACIKAFNCNCNDPYVIVSHSLLSAIHISGPNFTEKGEPIRISCNATSDTMTPARMDWFRDGIKIKQNADAGIFIHEYTIRESKSLYSELEIKKSTMKDAGTYICRSSRTDVVSHYVVVLNGKFTVPKKYKM